MIDEERHEFPSPDGRFLVERVRFWDDRGGPYGHLNLLALPERRLLVRLSDREPHQAPLFPGPGLVELLMPDRRLQPWRLRVDLVAGSFVTHPHDEPQPLSELPLLLDAQTPEDAAAAAQRRRRPRGLRTRLSDGFMLLGSSVLAGGGLWMGLTARTLRERWTGWFGLLFFGACAALPLWEAWRRRHPRRG